MKDFFKENKYFAYYLLGSLVSIAALVQSGNILAALALVLFVSLLFLYLYWQGQK